MCKSLRLRDATVGLQIDFCFLLRWCVTARIDLSLVGSYSPAGFEYGVCATTFSGRSLKWIQICIKSNAVDIFLLWIWSCMHFLEIVFCDCSMFCLCGHGVAFILWRLCFLIVPIQAWGFAAQVCASGFFLSSCLLAFARSIHTLHWHATCSIN